MIASKNWTLNAAAAARKKIRQRLNRSVDDFDSTEIRLGKSAKFDGAGVYGLPTRQLCRLQSVLHAAARIIFSARKFDHVTPLLRELQLRSCR